MTPSPTGERFARLAGAVARDGDRQAFEEIFDHFAPRLITYLQRLGVAPALAEELTQEVMTVLWHKAALFDPAKSSLSTWLFRIARNRRIDTSRRQRSGRFDPDDPFLQPAGVEPPDETVDAMRRDERIRAALAGLPEDQRRLVRMAFFAGLSHRQIATETGLPLGTVKSRIRLAFARLRKVIEADSGVDTD